MMGRFSRNLGAATMLAFLAACGGGGGGGGDSAPAAPSPTAPQTPPANNGNPSSSSLPVVFGQKSLVAYAKPNSTPTFAMSATVVPGLVSGALYVQVRGGGKVFDEDVEVSQTAPNTYWVRFAAMPNLPLGRYQGTLDVQLCKDEACKEPYAASPVKLPFDVSIIQPAPVSIASFAPAKVAATYAVGEPVSVTVRATLSLAVPDPFPLTATPSSSEVLMHEEFRGPFSSFARVDASNFDVVLKLSNALPVGRHKGVFTVSPEMHSFLDKTYELPYDITITPSPKDPRKLLPSDWGVAFSSSPNGSVLSRTLSLTESLSGAVNWTAQSDRPWLKVSAAGLTGAPGSALTLTADPASLPNDEVSYANVTVASGDPAVQGVVIPVALWKGSSPLAGPTMTSAGYFWITGDPIRPYVYAHNGGGSIDVINVHTARKVGALENLGGALSSMAVSPDGRRLFVLGQSVIHVVDLATGKTAASWPTTRGDTDRMVVIRPKGQEVVLLSNYENATGAGIGKASVAYIDGVAQDLPYTWGLLAPSPDTKRLYSIVRGSEYFMVSHDSDFGAGRFLLNSSARTPWANRSSGFPRDLAVSRAGDALYATLNETCEMWNPTDLSVTRRLPAPSGVPQFIAKTVDVASDGRVFCGVEYSDSFMVSDEKRSNFWVYSKDGTFLKGVFVPTVVDRALHSITQNGTELSADGLVLVVRLYPMGNLVFTAVGP